MILLELLWVFFKIGIVSFGGGYAMIPLIRDEVVSRGWLTQEELLNFIAVSESTPGPVSINLATFIGSSQGSVLGGVFGQFLGAFFATLGVVLPAFLVILLIASIMTGLLKYAGVKAFLRGLRPIVVGLIVATGVSLFFTVVLGTFSLSTPVSFNWRALVIFSIIALIWGGVKIFAKKRLSPIILILISAGLGMILYGPLGAI